MRYQVVVNVIPVTSKRTQVLIGGIILMNVRVRTLTDLVKGKEVVVTVN